MNIAMMQRFKEMERAIKEMQDRIKMLEDRPIGIVQQSKPIGRPRKSA